MDVAISPNHLLKADTEWPPFLVIWFWLYCFCFLTVRSNSPKPAEEEEKEKAPQTEESEETGKEEESKMEHWTTNVPSPFPSTRFSPAGSLLPPVRPSVSTPPLLPSSTVVYMYSFTCCFLLAFVLLDTERYSSVYVKNFLALSNKSIKLYCNLFADQSLFSHDISLWPLSQETWIV